VPSRGTDRFSIKAVFGELGVPQLSRAKGDPRSLVCKWNQSESRMRSVTGIARLRP
jgi:hypothetical protein